MEASSRPHVQDCPLGIALSQISKCLPPFSEREQWLAEDEGSHG
jgi:hypothetical protein